jgi:two-component system nitrate/nitrite response regulator NarL/two-component system nitrate/nitrite response regulator NarP
MILILDDHPLVRHGLSSIIRQHCQVEELLQAGTVTEAIDILKSNPVELAFVDINLGEDSGLSVISWIKENKHGIKVFVITSSPRQSDFRSAQKLDVDAYLLKDAFIDEITYGLKTVERGGKFYSPALVENLCKSSHADETLSLLTEREKEVMRLLGRGYSNAKISKTLTIAEGTTKKHISSILSKLHLESRVDVVLLANRRKEETLH